MSFYLRECFKLRPFVVGLVGLSHQLKDTAHYQQIQNDDSVIDESEFNNEKHRSDVKKIMITNMKNCGILGMSVAVSVNGSVMFEGGFGVKDVEKKIAITAETPANIASIAKIFTAYLIVKLFEDERFTTGTQSTYLNDLIHRSFTNQKYRRAKHHNRQNVVYPDKHTFSLSDLLCHRGDVRHYTLWEHHNTRPYESLTAVWKSLYHCIMMIDAETLLAKYVESYGVWLKPNNNTAVNYSSIGYEILGSFLEKNSEDFFSEEQTYHTIMSNELQRLNLNGTYLDEVLHVKFDWYRGYNRYKELEHKLEDLEEDLYNLKHTFHVAQDVVYLDYDIINGINQNGFTSVLQNGPYVDYSMMYASEGLVGTVGDLIKFSDMFLRMEQDLTGGKPLSSKLTKLMWSYRGVNPQYNIGDTWSGPNGLVVRRKNKYCLGWSVETELYKQEYNWDNQRYRTVARMAGSALGFGSVATITTIKNEDYRNITEFGFGSKAVRRPRVPGRPGLLPTPPGLLPHPIISNLGMCSRGKRDSTLGQQMTNDSDTSFEAVGVAGEKEEQDYASATPKEGAGEERSKERPFCLQELAYDDSDAIPEEEEEQQQQQRRARGITVAAIFNVAFTFRHFEIAKQLTDLYWDYMED